MADLSIPPTTPAPSEVIIICTVCGRRCGVYAAPPNTPTVSHGFCYLHTPDASTRY